MSCTVVAIPFSLMWVIGTIAASAATTSLGVDTDFDTNATQINTQIASKYFEKEPVITEQHFIEKTFETPFTDKTILLKTLEEHGVKNITEWENGIIGEVDNYKLTFEKSGEQKAYTVKISCSSNENAEEKLGDINSEYALNVQEDAYLHIIDRLKDNNMEVESEEVMDDNTIVLTVNIE